MRVDADDFYVLEDNARTPSGVSYMLENREVMMRLFPDLFAAAPRRAGRELSGRAAGDAAVGGAATAPAEPTVALLTPGPFNSAYYEHSFLADQLGIELVEGRDLFVRDDSSSCARPRGRSASTSSTAASTTTSSTRSPSGPNSLLGVPGLMNAYRAGNVTLANAVGTGVADDKAVYSYVPEIVRFYLGEEPILKNVPTWRCREPEALAYVLDHLERAGGQGGRRLRRLRHADRAGRRQGDARGVRREAQGRPATTSSPSRRWRSRPARPSSRRASRRATSTSGPSC